MKKLIVAITNRSSYNKVYTILKNLPAHVEPVLLLGSSIYFYKYGYAYNNIADAFPDLKIIKTSLAIEGDDLVKMPKAVGIGCVEIATILDNEKPDMVLTVADRYETMATAISASYMNIPLVHLQGGEISGTIDNKVRNAITQLADYHFPATDDAADRIMRMKPEDHNRIWNMGCPAMDLMTLDGKFVPLMHDELHKHGTGDIIDLYLDYIIVMINPDTKDEAFDISFIMNVLNEIDIAKIIFWPNIDPSSDVIAKAWRLSQQGFWKNKVRYVRHLDPCLFAGLMHLCSCIVGNSSAGIREATFLGTPSVTIGDRQKDRECGHNVMRVPLDGTLIKNAILKQLGSYYVSSSMYGDGQAGKKIGTKLGELLDAK